MERRRLPVFVLIGHDHGGRVSYRMALDHPKNVERQAVFDVIPIFEAWNQSDARFAQTYWPWILLSQKQPLPESYLLGAPNAVFDNPSDMAPLARRFSKNTFQLIVIRLACMASARNIELRQRSMLNTIVPTSKRPTKSNARCCIYVKRLRCRRCVNADYTIRPAYARTIRQLRALIPDSDAAL